MYDDRTRRCYEISDNNNLYLVRQNDSLFHHLVICVLFRPRRPRRYRVMEVQKWKRNIKRARRQAKKKTAAQPTGLCL